MFAVTTAKGPCWDHSRGTREQAAWEAHAAFADALVERGVVIVGGPIDDDDGEVVALLAVEAESEAQLRRSFAEGPWVESGVLRVKAVRSWTLWLDARSLPARPS